jgi:hypothetical protein
VVLATDDEDLDITSRKIKILCRDELEQAAADGTFQMTSRRWGLYGICRSIRDLLHIDCEENEGYNSLVRPCFRHCGP